MVNETSRNTVRVGLGVGEGHVVERHRTVERGAGTRVVVFFGEDGFVERFAQAAPRHADVEELVVERRQRLQRLGGQVRQELDGERDPDGELLAEDEGPGAVEHERGQHRAQELEERGVDVDHGRGPPASPTPVPGCVHELLGLDRVGPEVADLVAGAEVLLELAGDRAQLFA